MFEVQDRILIFDGECIITVSDAVKKIGNTFKASIISSYDEQGHQLKPTDVVEKVHIQKETNILQASETGKRRNI